MTDAHICPFLGKSCIKEKCKLWILLLGENPQTREPINTFDCAISWLPVLLVENRQALNGSQVSFESFRNEINNVAQVMAIGVKAKIESNEKKNRGLLGFFKGN